MSIKTQDTLSKQSNIKLPNKIQKVVSQRGFYLYEWISSKEVKMSVEKDFFKLIKYLGPVLAIFAILGYFIGSFLVFFGVLLLGIGGLLLYLSIIAIIRSKLLINNSQVVVTDSAISVGGKIFTLNQQQDLNISIYKIEGIFNEKLFGKSHLEEENQGLFSKVKDQILVGYKYIFESTRGRSSSKSGQLIMVLLLLYTLYVGFMLLAFIVGVFFVWLFTLMLTFIIQKILLLKGHEITVINDLFSDIGNYSDRLNDQKTEVQKYLLQAKKNEWKNSLLTNINNGIEKINDHALIVIDKSKDLQSTLEKSKYKKIFNFPLFHSWIKTQIYDPLFDLKVLLSKNLDIIIQSNKDILIQISQTIDPSLQGPLKLQQNRLEIQANELEKNIKNITQYLQKLQ